MGAFVSIRDLTVRHFLIAPEGGSVSSIHLDQALSWTFTVAGLLLTIGRFAIRKRLSGKPQWADWLNIAAALLLVVYVSLYATYFRLIYDVTFYAMEHSSEDTGNELIRFSELVLTLSILFWMIM